MILLTMLLISAEPWVPQGEREGFAISTRDEPKSDIKGVRAVGPVRASLPQLLAHLRDIEGSKEWIPKIKTKFAIGETSDAEAITYSITDMPWPLDDREMIVHNKLYLDQENKALSLVSKSVDHQSFPEKEGIERAYVTYSNLILRPIDERTTHVDMQIMVDPNGFIPSFIVNYYQKRWPSKFLKRLEAHISRKKIPVNAGLKNFLTKLLLMRQLPTDYFSKNPDRREPAESATFSNTDKPKPAKEPLQ